MQSTAPRVLFGFFAVLLGAAVILVGCDLTGSQSTPQSPQFTVENDLERRITYLGDQAQSSLEKASDGNFVFEPIIRVAPPVANGNTTVASYLSFNANGGDRVFVGYKIRGEGFGGGIDILNAEDPDSLASVNSVRSSNLDVQEVVDDPDGGAEYVAGALQTNLADASPAAIVKLPINYGGRSIGQTTDKRLSENVAKSVVNAPPSDSQHDLYVATDGNSLYRYTTDLDDQVQQTASGVEFSSIAAHQDRVIMLTKTGELWRSGISSTSPPSTDSTVSLNGSGINPVGIARMRTGTHAATGDRFVFAALNQGGFRVLNAGATTTLFSRTSGHYTSVSASGEGNYLYASRDNGRVEVYEFTGSTGAPSWTSSPIATINTRTYGSVPPETQANQVLAVGNYLYVANSRGGVLVLSFADNPAPTANDDSDQTMEDQSRTTDVLANDSDPDGSLDPATVQVQSGPSSGSVNVDAQTGEITYTPDPDFTGSDSYTYTVGDGDGATSDPATVSITVSATNAATVGCAGAIGGGIAFTIDGDLQTLSSDEGTTSELLSTPANRPVLALGTGVDLDDDGNVGVVYVQENPDAAVQTLKVVDANDSLATTYDLPVAAKTSKTLLGVGSWSGSGPSSFYVAKTGNGDEIFRVPFDGGSVQRIANPANGVDAILGVADIDGDDQNELVFVGGSQQTRYVEQSDGVTASFTKVPNAGAGSNNNIGIGSCLADVDGDGSASIPLVGGSNQIRLADASGVHATLITGSDNEQAAKTPLAWAEVDNDGETELVYLENNNSPAELKYVDEVNGAITFKVLTDANGNRIEASTSSGIVSAQ